MDTPFVSIKDIEKKWFIVDAENKVLGRLATGIAKILIGKHKPEYVHYMDIGDFVVVVNADKVKLTGKKWSDKIYYRHSSYPGGLRQRTALEVHKKHPERLILEAVKGMLPNNKMRAPRLKKLKVYSGVEHPHSAQKPEKLEI
ncbi:MAG: 50S ribosomal protein L13 [Candidatus Eremiobacteraeota bacterium]|nr:50S ribosomal protein L13 [Candidatus Eremiobacteraeota bacterium]